MIYGLRQAVVKALSKLSLRLSKLSFALCLSSMSSKMSSPNHSGTLGNAEDDELTLPRASVNKMIKEIMPSARVANEARELILNCCTEFIHLLSSEANDICNQLNKKTISAEHILMGLCLKKNKLVCYACDNLQF